MRPKKSLGQNFLIDPNYKRKIIQSLGPLKNLLILEIGPGRGVLSEELVQKCQKLWLIEKDGQLCCDLQERFGSYAIVCHDDFLDTDLKKILGKQKQKIIALGNLPYNVASQIYIKLIQDREFFSDFYLMFQKEMAKRFMASPGTKDYGLLTLWAQVYTDCKILFHLPPTVFRPQPKVWSSFIHFKIKDEPLIKKEEEEFFWGLMRKLFQQRRKTIRAVLKNEWDIHGRAQNFSPLHFEPLQKNPSIRAEALSVKELIQLAQWIRKET